MNRRRQAPDTKRVSSTWLACPMREKPEKQDIVSMFRRAGKQPNYFCLLDLPLLFHVVLPMFRRAVLLDLPLPFHVVLCKSVCVFVVSPQAMEQTTISLHPPCVRRRQRNQRSQPGAIQQPVPPKGSHQLMRSSLRSSSLRGSHQLMRSRHQLMHSSLRSSRGGPLTCGGPPITGWEAQLCQGICLHQL